MCDKLRNWAKSQNEEVRSREKSSNTPTCLPGHSCGRTFGLWIITNAAVKAHNKCPIYSKTNLGRWRNDSSTHTKHQAEEEEHALGGEDAAVHVGWRRSADGWRSAETSGSSFYLSWKKWAHAASSTAAASVTSFPLVVWLCGDCVITWSHAPGRRRAMKRGRAGLTDCITHTHAHAHARLSIVVISLASP